MMVLNGMAIPRPRDTSSNMSPGVIAGDKAGDDGGKWLQSEAARSEVWGA